jgi:hypothetical protein
MGTRPDVATGDDITTIYYLSVIRTGVDRENEPGLGVGRGNAGACHGAPSGPGKARRLPSTLLQQK